MSSTFNTLHYCRLYSSPVVTVPNITNEPILNFAPGSKERNDVIKVTESVQLDQIHIVSRL